MFELEDFAGANTLHDGLLNKYAVSTASFSNIFLITINVNCRNFQNLLFSLIALFYASLRKKKKKQQFIRWKV